MNRAGAAAATWIVRGDESRGGSVETGARLRYHPHHHGATAVQNSGGMYGSIEINDPEFTQPGEIEALPIEYLEILNMPFKGGFDLESTQAQYPGRVDIKDCVDAAATTRVVSHGRSAPRPRDRRDNALGTTRTSSIRSRPSTTGSTCS